MNVRTFAVLCLAAFAVPTVPRTAAAQSRPAARAVISVNGAFQPTEHPFTDRLNFDVNRETGSTTVRYPGESGVAIDAGVSADIWRNLGVGVAVSRFASDETAGTESQLPHPFFFGMPRQLAADVSGLRRTELAVHTAFVYRLPTARQLRVALFAGPSFMNVEQDTIVSIEYDESFPFDTVTFRSARQRKSTGSAVTFNAGADIGWMFTRHLGIGGLARFAEATVDLDLGEGRTQSVTAGGFSAGAGIRLAF
jgi:hypothetical protein